MTSGSYILITLIVFLAIQNPNPMSICLVMYVKLILNNLDFDSKQFRCPTNYYVNVRLILFCLSLFLPQFDHIFDFSSIFTYCTKRISTVILTISHE